MENKINEILRRLTPDELKALDKKRKKQEMAIAGERFTKAHWNNVGQFGHDAIGIYVDNSIKKKALNSLLDVGLEAVDALTSKRELDIVTDDGETIYHRDDKTGLDGQIVDISETEETSSEGVESGTSN